MRTLRLRKVVAQDHVTRIQKSKEVCRMMRPDLPSPTQNVAQILQDSVRVLCFFFLFFFFLKNKTASRAPSQTQSQISRGAAQKPAFPREPVQGSVRPGRPLLPWLGEGTGPYHFPFATPFPKLQGECTSAGPNFLPAFAQTAPSAPALSGITSCQLQFFAQGVLSAGHTCPMFHLHMSQPF